jgi:hypothetical protein
MKILILDYLFPQNHVSLYCKIIECLSSVGQTKVITKKDYYSGYENNLACVEIEEIVARNDGKNMLSRKFQSFNSMLKTRKIVSNSKDSLKFVLTFDTVSFAFGRLLTGSNSFFILHHKNIDELNNKIKKIIFKTYMNKVNHIVFEDYFKEYLIKEIGVNEKLVHVIPHPVFDSETSNGNEIIYDCIGLSNSNDESFIKKIIDEERKNGYLKNANLQVVLRSKKYQFDNGNLKVINGFLPKEEYDSYFKKCKVVFIPLPDNFIYRVSGVMYDALSNHKIVIANKVPIVNQYEKKYPNICIGINNVNEFFEKVLELKFNEEVEDDFYNFKKCHEKNTIIKKFIDTFEGVKINESKKK